MNEQLKIVAQNKRITTLKELFEGKNKARKLMAGLPFEEKIKILISLQEVAYNWGGKKDVLIWKGYKPL